MTAPVRPERKSLSEEREEVWLSGNLYESYVGRWSRHVAREFLTWLKIPKDKDWLDVGCGTGALAGITLQQNSPHRVKGFDPSASFIGYAKANVSHPHVSFESGDAHHLAVASASFDVAVSGLVLNFLAQPLRAVGEMARVVRPDGTVAAYVWDYADKMELIRYFWDAAVMLDPTALALHEGHRFPLCHPEPLAELFVQAGLRSVEVKAIDVPTVFRDFEDYWSPFLDGQGPAPSYCVSLSSEHRNALRDRIQADLPVAANGSVTLVARVWAVRGRTPK